MGNALLDEFHNLARLSSLQRKPRSQSVSAPLVERQLSVEQAAMAAVNLSRARHGSVNQQQHQNNVNHHHHHQQQQSGVPTPNLSAMISLGDTNLYNRTAPQHSMNSCTANVNVPSARKLDRSISEPGDRNANVSSSKNSNINSSRYKTELCRPFEENGYCKYGDKCQFAHGGQEQRSLSRHPKYKTEPCRTFHTVGFCPYGPRCHFIHNEDERRLNAINQMKQQQAVAQAALQQAAAQNTLQQLQSQLQQQHHMQQQSPVSVGLPVHSLPTHSVSSPTPVQRPSTLNFSSLASLNLFRDSLGSTADSPPSSFTDSPTMSPSFLAEDLLAASLTLSHCTTPPASAPAAPSRAFTFPETARPPRAQQLVKPPTPTPIMTPLNVQTDPIISLAAGLQATTLNQRNNSLTNDVLRELNNSFYTPPSPPDSLDGDNIPAGNLCDSPLDVGRSFRLPIFSQFANEWPDRWIRLFSRLLRRGGGGHHCHFLHNSVHALNCVHRTTDSTACCMDL